MVDAKALLALLTPEAQTSRGQGNWGLRILCGQEDQLVIETPRREPADWPKLAITWLSDDED